MPRVTIEMYPGRTKSQKAELARVITEAMVTIANTQAQAVDIVFNEVSPGKLVLRRSPRLRQITHPSPFALSPLQVGTPAFGGSACGGSKGLNNGRLVALP